MFLQIIPKLHIYIAYSDSLGVALLREVGEELCVCHREGRGSAGGGISAAPSSPLSGLQV